MIFSLTGMFFRGPAKNWIHDTLFAVTTTFAGITVPLISLHPSADVR